MPKFPVEKELFLMNMADTREIECTLVPDTKRNADVAVCKQCNSTVKLAGRHLTHVKSYEAPPSFLVL